MACELQATPDQKVHMLPVDFVTMPIAPSPPPGGVAFLETGNLVDRELELVTPDDRWVDDVLAACRHPLTRAQDPDSARLTRNQVLRFLESVPYGHESPFATSDGTRTYHFWMRLLPEYDPPVPIAGAASLRIGNTADLVLYYGHIGYNVYPPARGHHYAQRACRLLFGLAKAHHLNPLWITTDPDNAPSRRTCQLLGAELVDVVDIPQGHPLHQRGQRRKCRYRIDL
jgi:predicted acetyltransferase